MKKSMLLVLSVVLLLGVFFNSYFVLADDISATTTGSAGGSVDSAGNVLVGGSCGTVSPDSRNACCVAKGYDSWNETSGACISATGSDSAGSADSAGGVVTNDAGNSVTCVNNSDCVAAGYPTALCVNGVCRGLGAVTAAASKIRSEVKNEVQAEVQARVKEIIQQRVEKAYEASNGENVNIAREAYRQGNVTSVQITRTITFANGTKVNETVQLQVGNQSGKPVKALVMEREKERYNVSIEGGLNVSDEFVGNQSVLRANLSNGKKANITVLPDQAVKAALARLKIRNQVMNNGTNITLKERIHNKVPQVVYNVETNQQGKFLGIFKVAMKSNVEVDSANGNVVSVKRPWWAFLVSVPKTDISVNATVNDSVNSS